MKHFVRLMGIGLVLWSCVVTPAVSSAAQAAASDAATGTVLVTGSSRGIGLEFARQYAAAGWTVIATARKPTESANLRELARRHPNVRLEALDVVDGVSVSALRDRLRGVAIDVLINNAGDTDQFRGQSLGSLDHDRFDYLMRLNAQGPLRVTEARRPRRRHAGWLLVQGEQGGAQHDGRCAGPGAATEGLQGRGPLAGSG